MKLLAIVNVVMPAQAGIQRATSMAHINSFRRKAGFLPHYGETLDASVRWHDNTTDSSRK